MRTDPSSANLPVICNIYQSLIFEKIFGGMKQRYLNHITAEQAENVDEIRTWLEDDLNTCITRKKNDFIAVLRALARNAEEKETDILRFELYSIMNDNWISKVFESEDGNPQLPNGPNFILSAFNSIMLGEDSRFGKTLDGLFKFILAEDEIAKPDSKQSLKKKK